MSKVKAQEIKENGEPFFLVGKAFYPCLHTPNKASNPPKYKLDLVLDAATNNALEAAGVPIKNKATGKNVKIKDETDTRGDFVTITKNSLTKDGETLQKPSLVDAKTNEIPFTTLVGNESLVKVRTSIYEFNFLGKKGKKLNLLGVQVLDLVPYKSTGGFKEEEGYTTTSGDNE